jgi:hypothetical protein
MLKQGKSHGLASYNAGTGAPCSLSAVDRTGAMIVAAVSDLPGACRQQLRHNARAQ